MNIGGQDFRDWKWAQDALGAAEEGLAPQAPTGSV
jgi:hypothetical protein